MFRIKMLNKISQYGLNALPDGYEVSEGCENPDAVLVRSADMHGMEFSDNLLAIARAGAGVNNIPIEECSKKGIVVFNTPGANANAVKELAIAGLLLSSRKIVSGIEWARTLKGKGGEVGKLVEKGKGSFGGPEIKGKTIGVIGLGAIGVMVANAARSLGMTVFGYDPYISVDGAWTLSRAVKHAHSLDEIFAVSDYVTIHVPLNDATRGMVNEASIAKMRDGVRILNFSRAELVNEDALIASLKTGKISSYVVDFPTDAVLDVEGIIAIPHLGASTPESEDNCAVMAAEQLDAFLRNGNIINSVNYPSMAMPRSTETRVLVLHRNIKNVISLLASAISAAGVNIENMESRSKGEYACAVFDIVANGVSEQTLAALRGVEGVVSVRVI